MEQDPLTYEVKGRDGDTATTFVDFVVPDTELWRVRLWQVLSRSGGGTVTLTFFAPGGKQGGSVIIGVNIPVAPVIRTVTFPQTRDPTGTSIGIRTSALYLDIPAGWTLRASLTDGPGDADVTAVVGYERITQDRIKLSYGFKAQLNLQTGVISYPQVRKPTDIPVRINIAP